VDHGHHSSSSTSHHLSKDPIALPAGQSLGIEGIATAAAPTPSTLLPSLPSLATSAGGAGVAVSDMDRQSLAATMANQRAASRANAETLPYQATHRPTGR
jgi:hypothetical protein